MTCLTDAWLQCYSLETCLAVWDCSEMTYAASFVLQPMSQKWFLGTAWMRQHWDVWLTDSSSLLLLQGGLQEFVRDKMSIRAVIVGRPERRTPLLVNMYSQFKETFTQHEGTVQKIVPKEEVSALLRPHLQCCTQVWSPQHRKSVALLEQCRGEPQRWSETEQPSHEVRVRELGVVSLEEALGELTAAFQHLEGAYRGRETHADTERRNSFQLQEERLYQILSSLLWG